MHVIRILIVDDNMCFRELVKGLLEFHTDLKVVGEAVNGRDAIDKARLLEPDLCLMDVNMPVMDGFDATRHLIKKLSAMKIILMSLFDTPGYRDAAIASGASGYIVKGTLPDELFYTIRDIMEDRRESCGT